MEGFTEGICEGRSTLSYSCPGAPARTVQLELLVLLPRSSVRGVSGLGERIDVAVRYEVHPAGLACSRLDSESEEVAVEAHISRRESRREARRSTI